MVVKNHFFRRLEDLEKTGGFLTFSGDVEVEHSLVENGFKTVSLIVILQWLVLHNLQGKLVRSLFHTITSPADYNLLNTSAKLFRHSEKTLAEKFNIFKLSPQIQA